MTQTSHFHRRLACVAACILMASAGPAYSAGEGVLLGLRLPAHSILKASPAELAAAVADCVKANPAMAGRYVTAALLAGRADTDQIAPGLTGTALAALGKNPPAGEITNVVRAAVKAAPTEVLEIVPVAVKAVPRQDATIVVAAAAGAVPNPQKVVSAGGKLASVASDGKETADGKEVLDGKETAEMPKQMTIAEAIVDAAMQADPGLSASDLTAAVDSAMTTTGITLTGETVLTQVLTPNITILPREPDNGGLRGVVSNPGSASP